MFAVICIPDFSLQSVLRHQPELRSRSVALLDSALPKSNICQLTSAARARGVAQGLTASQALARCGDLMIKARSLAQEDAATEVLLQTAYSFSPNIEATAPGVCTLELKGLGLDGDAATQKWAEHLLQVLGGFKLAARIGIAATPALAWLAAEEERVPESKLTLGDSYHCSFRSVRDATGFISALPIAALHPTAEISHILERWGIRTVGALLALDKTELAHRLGPEVIGLLQQVSRHEVRPLKLVVPKPLFAEQIEFEHDIETAEPLLFILRRFVEQLARRLQVIHLVVAQMHLRLGLASGLNYEQTFQIPAPTGSVDALFRTLQTHLEMLRTDTAIHSVRLEVQPCPPDAHQFGLFETTLKDPNQFAETLARLIALCGADRVGTPVVEATHRPDAFRMQAPEFQARQPLPCAALESSALKAGFSLPGLQLRRFRPALSVFVEFREHRPALVRGSVFNGALADVRGPFFSSGDWWDCHPWSREEWDVQAADGAIYRIYRSPEGCFVEGVYD